MHVVINKGAIWRVGNGELIDVRKHQWLPDLACSKIVSPRASSLVNQVCDLFYPNTRIWDPGKLDGCFSPWEAELVGRIPVNEGWDEDILIWPLTLDGDRGGARNFCLGGPSATLIHLSRQLPHTYICTYARFFIIYTYFLFDKLYIYIYTKKKGV